MYLFPFTITALLLAAILRYMGRMWWCDCNQAALWVGETLSHHTSQHLIDPYSITHFQHGLAFFLLLVLIGKGIRSFSGSHGDNLKLVYIPLLLESIWEVLENSSFIIDRYRAVTISLDYYGDSIVNSIGDLGACFLGYCVARKIGVRCSVLLYVILEILTVVIYKDSLLLNVIMLVAPVEAIKTWQQR